MMYRAMKATLLKLAASQARMTIAQTRSGRRPMSVATLLKKDQEGSLFKRAGSYALEAGGPQGTAAPFPDEGLRGTPLHVLRGRPRKGDVPSLTDENWSEERIDGRGAAVTQVSPSTEAKGIEV